MKGINLEDMSFLLKLISDKTRLTMLAYLKNGEMCVCEFVAVFDLSQPAISQHLKKLRTAGIICERKQGTWVYYRLNPDLPVYISDLIRALPTLIIKKCSCQTSKLPPTPSVKDGV
ncbi:metalloregulator ArsR/SmtB family transcription factor [Sporolactobacillus sp. CPB3-1]|uniref:Metalloregulator ArsR/SmtB family transcription factor n=1 Tax=Sporolactobacillus mangiferae TaxID=2940498 RepID=A0ABT0MB96_9BACL|nr:metalloregulator ArsR/SmtB family transcription factor [Sporolactobacillus mangiferae]MCL1631958.1 metalloregulator ArsR/SmtB family transcription factor [Sporolactobacillus mangiferae]